MKKLSLLFAFVGFFAMTNVSAQSAKYCIFPDGTCILCPSNKTCDAKAVKTCSPAEATACKKMADTGTCNKSAVALKSVEKSTCQKVSTTATATTVANKSETKATGNTCCGLPVTCCSKAKATSTGQLAEKMN